MPSHKRAVEDYRGHEGFLISKMMMKRINEQLVVENAELLARLAEAEDALNAIRGGHVDAVVISGVGGHQIYSMSSAEAPYQTFIEEMNEGAVTLTKDGTVIYSNKKFAQLVGEPGDQVIGSPLTRFMAPVDQAVFTTFLALLASSESGTIFITLANSLYLKLSLGILPPYLQGDNYILIATDVSEMRKKEIELRNLHSLLKQNFEKLQLLRLDLFDANFEMSVAKDMLLKANEELVREITRTRIANVRLKQKMSKPKG